jgi:hypothetical protein
MPNLGIRQRASKRGRKALVVALGSCFAGLCAAAPAHAGQVVISGTSDSIACVLSYSGAYDSCNGSVLDVPSADEANVVMHFDVAGNLPSGNCIDDVAIWAYRIVGNPSWSLDADVDGYRPRPMYDSPFTTAATWNSPDGVGTWDGGGAFGYPEVFREQDAHWMATDSLWFADNDVLVQLPDDIDVAGPASANAPKMIVNYSAC